MSTFSEWLKRSALRPRGRLRSVIGGSGRAPNATLVRPILRSWGIDRFHIEGMLGDTSATSWLVETPAGRRFALRRVGCRVPYLDYQVRVMRHLSTSDFPYDVPEVMPTRAGLDYVLDGDEKWVLYRFIEGDDLPEPASPADVRAVGVLVAHYDRAIATIDPGDLRGRFPLRLFNAERVERMLGHGARWLDDHDDTPGLNAAYARYRDGMAAAYHAILDAEARAIARLESITVYNDWHRYNMVARSGTISGLIDYDSIMEGPRIVDFQNALTYILIGRAEVDPDRIRAFHDGYGSILPLSSHEVDLVHPLMIDRVAWLITDILEEVHQHGASSRQDLAIQLMRLLSWLGHHRDEFTRALATRPDSRSTRSDSPGRPIDGRR